MNDIPDPIDLEQLDKTARINRRAIFRLREQVAHLEQVLDLVCGDAQMQWLYRNRSERMDATLPLFDSNRRAFHLARYNFAQRFVAEKQVADIACGTGYGCSLLAAGGADRVFGIDICPEAIQYAESKHAADAIDYRCCSGTDTGIQDESVDLVVSFETIEHVEDNLKLLAEFNRILRKGGRLICSTPNQWPIDVAIHHVREYDRNSFEAALTRYFSIESMYNQNSGSDSPFNREQPSGIVETTSANEELAECFIAVAQK